MATFPPTRLEKLQFYEARLPKWTMSATQIGVTPASVTALTTRADDARAAYTQHVAAQANAKSATLNWYEKLRLLHNATGAGADMVRQMRTKAVSTNDPNVYVLADIPAPATPSPVGAPGTPFGFKVTLNPDGSVNLKWKCANPAGSGGTIYQVARRIGAGGDFVTVTSVGTRSFTDSSVPAGTASVTYRITAVRSTALGVAGEFTVNFGTGSSGEMVASVVSAAAPKLAA